MQSCLKTAGKLGLSHEDADRYLQLATTGEMTSPGVRTQVPDFYGDPDARTADPALWGGPGPMEELEGAWQEQLLENYGPEKKPPASSWWPEGENDPGYLEWSGTTATDPAMAGTTDPTMATSFDLHAPAATALPSDSAPGQAPSAADLGMAPITGAGDYLFDHQIEQRRHGQPGSQLAAGASDYERQQLALHYGMAPGQTVSDFLFD